MRKTLLVLILILLLALALRLFRLTEIPPGLTHDEANHGREAVEILDGVLRYYFPLNYGSEPIYSYTVAASMALLGENLFALRLVNVIFGVATIAITAVWARQAFDRATALIAAGLLAVSFWPLATSREALRAGMLPFFTVLAVWFYWQIVCDRCGKPGLTDREVGARSRWRLEGLVLGFTVSIVATFHIYLAARVSWLLFPLFLFYLALFQRGDFRRAWRPAVAGLLLAGLLLVPMFAYLANNPFAQTRLSMLRGPLADIAALDLGPILGSAGEALLAFFWPGYGDQFLAYNIPGRPVLDLISGAFFLIGLFVALWRWREPAYAFLLLWFLSGIIPSLLTGSTANTTRNLAALPATYLLASVGFVAGMRGIAARSNVSQRALLAIGGAIWLAVVAIVSARDYFSLWGETAGVRSAYQSTLVEELAYLDSHIEDGRPVVISTVYPGAAHDPSIGLIVAGGSSDDFRWIDARGALILPEDDRASAIIPSSTPIHPAFEKYLQLQDTITVRADDLDPQFSTFRLINALPDGASLQDPLADFGSAVQLLDARWLNGQVRPGDTAELLTIWQVTNPENVGPAHPPTFQTDVVFFTHLLDDEGALISQHDALDAPSWSWQTGDIIMQVHRLELTDGLARDTYYPFIGIYDRQTGDRLPLYEAARETDETLFAGQPLEVAKS